MNVNRVEPGMVERGRSLEYNGPRKQMPTLSENSSRLQEERIHSLTQEQQEKLEEQIKKLNESIASSGKELQFKYHEDAKQLYVEVLDSKTREVLSSLPPEFLIELSLKMKEMIGMFLDEKI